MKHPRIYNLDRNLVVVLENAYDIGYEKHLNELWTARFSLPADDPKNIECQPFRFVEIFDGDERVDLFRIVPAKTARSSDGKTITYELEHVLATLLDDLLFQYHQIGGTGIYTDEILQYILDAQETVNWQLGTVDFNYQYQYKWENENLLAAIFAVPKPFVDEYQWAWDTNSYPWTLNLVAPSDEVSAYIRYGKNLIGIEKEEDPTEICTRLYALGYGEGVNQLTIEGVNDGVPYLDADTQATYGVISRVYVDRKEENAETLKAKAQAMLEKSKLPKIMNSVEGADLYQLTKDSIDKFDLGKKVRVIDEELGIDIESHVVSLSKSDITGAPGDIQIDIANKVPDIADGITELADRTRVNQVYAQGATNLDSHDFADNCDPDNPAVIRFYIPQETVRINKMLLNYDTESFRAYSKGAASGGGDTSGASSKNTTEGGGDHRHKVFEYLGGMWDGYEGFDTDDNGSHNHSTGTVSDHNHGITDGTELATADGGSVTFVESGGHGHITGSNGKHAHEYNYPLIVMEALKSEVDNDFWNVGLAAPEGGDIWTWGSSGQHTHNMEHNHSVPNHTHNIDYGIYNGPTPSGVTVKVDGNEISGLGTSETDVDIVDYLEKDAAGKISRGAWHEVTVTPNNLGRIVANIFSQFFVQSRGGGDY